MLLNINETNLKTAIGLIFSIFGYENLEVNNSVFLTKENYKFYDKRRTQYDVGNDIIYFYNAPDLDKYENLGALVHECYHVIQKRNGVKLGYSTEHQMKYGEYDNHPANHMFMFVKYYPFESEANGYARAFVYFYLKTIFYSKKANVEKMIEEYSKPVSFTLDEVETENDYQEVKKALWESYNTAFSFFDNNYFLQNNELLDIFKSEEKDTNKIEQLKWYSSRSPKNSMGSKMISLYNMIEKNNT